ncbi:unnamed protein product [Penicillium palitans]
MTCEHVDTLGILPPEWRKRWEARQNKFTEDAQAEEGVPSFDAKERDAIFNMLRPMLSFSPEDRPTTKQILECEWMVKWALPEYGKI